MVWGVSMDQYFGSLVPSPRSETITGQQFSISAVFTVNRVFPVDLGTLSLRIVKCL